MKRLALGVFTAAIAAAALAEPKTSAALPDGDEAFMRGMVVSCPRAGQIWGSPQMTEALQAMQPLGVEWVAIHPYAGVRRDGSIRNWLATETGYLPQAVQRIRDEKMSLFWKPHLAYWGSFSWRGEIEFGDDEAAWRRFFNGYRDFILDQARFAERHNVPLFAVGVELDRTATRELEWRAIIRAVRQVYSGQLTYAANWDTVARIPFWDALDLIGVHAYFPLGDGSEPDRAALRRAWTEPLALLGELSKAHRIPVVLAEIGYTRSARAAIEPWAYGTTDTPENRRLRQLLIETAVEAVEDAPAIRGMFWWKWIPGSARWDRDFSMKDPEAKAALSAYWGSPPPNADVAPAPSRPAAKDVAGSP